MNDATLQVRADAPIGTISPRLYGHFAEHIGRCCYDGLWTGADATDVNHEGGFRRDVLDVLRALPVPLLRWPGGCYADHYHWRDGIGAPGARPRRLGMSCGLTVEDDNGLGTHEFLQLCALIGAEQPAQHEPDTRAAGERRICPVRGCTLGSWQRELGMRWQL